jgi:hypothetical protein
VKGSEQVAKVFHSSPAPEQPEGESFFFVPPGLRTGQVVRAEGKGIGLVRITVRDASNSQLTPAVSAPSVRMKFTSRRRIT